MFVYRMLGDLSKLLEENEQGWACMDGVRSEVLIPLKALENMASQQLICLPQAGSM